MVCNFIDIYWRQRAKQHWVVDGDRNTNFLHEVADKKFNAVYNVEVDGEPYVDGAAVKNVFVQFYENLYHDDEPSRLFLDGIAFTEDEV